MTYQWKLPGIYNVSAQTAGEELDRIYHSRGKLEPADIVNESREADAPLHGCFEWDDAVAAEKYRENQASDIIRAVVIVDDTHEEMNNIRAFVHVESTYQPMKVVVKSENKMQKLLQSVSDEVSDFRRKYNRLSELKPAKLENENKKQERLQSAMRELSDFRKEYIGLSELQPVFSAIDAISA